MRDRRHAGGGPSWICFLAILGLAALYPWWPLAKEGRWALTCLLEAGAVAAAWTLTLRRPLPRAWRWLLAGFTLNAIADSLYWYESVVVRMGMQLGVSDLAYGLAYVPLTWGLVTMGRGSGRDTGALLDAAIFAVGLAVPVVAFYVIPAATDVSLGLQGILIIGWYSLASVLVLALFVRQVTAARGRNPAFLMLGGALLSACAGDLLWNVEALSVDGDPFYGTSKLLWFLDRTLPLAAILHPACARIWEPQPPVPSPQPGLRLAALTLGSLMPAITLLLASTTDQSHPYWIAAAAGGLLLPVLVLVRMGGMLGQLDAQARQLDALSRFDELTGAPNRRSWNQALEEAFEIHRDPGRPLALALIDLDHFKRYNDSHGHHAGDDLLRRAYEAWSVAIPADAVLARFGGEEFALMLPDASLDRAAAILADLRAATPGSQTFSAGLGLWDGRKSPEDALDAADAALYRAKQAGRDRVELVAH